MLSPMRAFCTYFDHRYLTRALALWESLQRTSGPAALYALCMDDVAFDRLQALALPDLHPVRLQELEAADPALAKVKATRSTIEYYFTTTPAFPLFLLEQHPELTSITYLDADLWFFDSIEPLFAELGDASVGIIRHRFPPSLVSREVFGIFNVGCLIFRNNANAREVLEWWRERCLEWCYDRLEADRFADQKYLNGWPTQFRGVAVLEHKGANVAPWNVAQYELSERAGRVFVDDVPLLFYHFHGLRNWRGALWKLGLLNYGVPSNRVLLERVYRPYIEALQSWAARVPSDGDAAALARPGTALNLPQLVKAPYYWLRRELVTFR
jgi:hypothetical protein